VRPPEEVAVGIGDIAPVVGPTQKICRVAHRACRRACKVEARSCRKDDAQEAKGKLSRSSPFEPNRCTRLLFVEVGARGRRRASGGRVGFFLRAASRTGASDRVAWCSLFVPWRWAWTDRKALMVWGFAGRTRIGQLTRPAAVPDAGAARGAEDASSTQSAAGRGAVASLEAPADDLETLRRGEDRGRASFE